MIAKISNKSLHLLIVSVIIVSCKSEDVRHVSFDIDGKSHVCLGYYMYDKLDKFICKYENGKIMALQKRINSSDTFYYINYYENGKIKEEGALVRDNFLGKWETYYSNNKKKSLKFFEIRNDTSYLIYVKNYFENGLLESSILPLDIEVAEKALTKGNSYNLKIELKYSEFDSVHSIVFFDKNEKIKFEMDSIYSMSRIVNTTFNPLYSGDLIITGTYAELGANEIYSSELMIAKKPFAIKIYVKK